MNGDTRGEYAMNPIYNQIRTYKRFYIKKTIFIHNLDYKLTNMWLYRDLSSVLERRRTLELDITKTDLMRHDIGAILFLDTFDIYRFSTTLLYLQQYTDRSINDSNV